MEKIGADSSTVNSFAFSNWNAMGQPQWDNIIHKGGEGHPIITGPGTEGICTLATLNCHYGKKRREDRNVEETNCREERKKVP